MGGWMNYQRFRARNGLDWHPPTYPPDPYPRDQTFGRETPHWALIVGDLNRMERDYLAPVYPEPPFATRPEGSDPASVCAQETGIDVETVRAVLRFVFLGHPTTPEDRP